MQIGEDDLALAQLRPFAGLGLLDLHDHIGAGENLGRGVGDRRSGLAVDLIGRADSRTRIGFDDDAMACSYILARRARCEANAVLLHFDLLGHSDAHGWALPFLNLSNM